jgi:hypothetical protein
VTVGLETERYAEPALELRVAALGASTELREILCVGTGYLGAEGRGTLADDGLEANWCDR